MRNTFGIKPAPTGRLPKVAAPRLPWITSPRRVMCDARRGAGFSIAHQSFFKARKPVMFFNIIRLEGYSEVEVAPTETVRLEFFSARFSSRSPALIVRKRNGAELADGDGPLVFLRPVFDELEVGVHHGQFV